ncbi:MAG: polyphosphate kinase 2 family protein [Candidatus Delongbacteria bacterium]|nr:polyphosphate kinase 2 family protein [Candidatus Delongbacteria bacterium]
MDRIDPSATPGIDDKDRAREELAGLTKRLIHRQQLLYADNRQALLVVLQAMDTGGKDGTIRKVFGPLNPQGVRVCSFKSPSSEELAHDFLWRIHANVPRKGMIRIFNRSHYEDVLVVRVHNLVPTEEVELRYSQINEFEHYLSQNGITILKFCLHIGKDEQKRRLESRLERPEKNWKFSSADLAERQHWGEYQLAYQKALGACSTPWAPWHVIPSDHKWHRDYCVARIVLEKLESMDLKFPDPQPGLDQIIIGD